LEDTSPTEDHAPELYRPDRIAPSVETFDEITDEHVRQYEEQGFILIRQALAPAEVDAAIRGLVDLVAGRVADFPTSRIMLEKRHAGRYGDLSENERLDAVRKVAAFVQHEARLKALAEHPKLQGVLRRLMGDEPVLFQDMALVKPPGGGREKPWHQDCAYFQYPPGTKVVGVWIALDEATVLNGCMHLLPGQHRLGPRLHFRRRDWQMCDTDAMAAGADHCLAAPVPPGGVLLFDGLLPHGTPTNHSNERRRALQYHYAPASATKLSRDEANQLFGGEMQGAYC
jgi:phytanoyl-CoA hydroxylase